MISGKTIQYLVSLSVSLATLNYGVIIGWPSPAIPKLNHDESGIHLTEGEISWMVAIASIGFMIGSLLSRFTSDQYGRKSTLLLSAVPVLLGTIILAFAKTGWLLDLLRFFWGLGSGLLIPATTMYVAEIANKDIRGTLTMICRLQLNVGSLLVMVIGGFVTYWNLNYSLIVFPIGYFLFCLWIPESPYYYLKEGKIKEARKALMQLKRFEEEKELEQALLMMQDDVNREMQRSGSIIELFTKKRYRKAVIILFGLKFTLLLSGTIVLPQYLGVIMNESKSTVALSTVFIAFGVARFLVGMLSTFVVDIFGRRPLLIYSCLGSAISLFIVGLYFFLTEVMLYGDDVMRPYGIIPLVGNIAACVFSAAGINSLLYVILSEVFPLNVKAVAVSSFNVIGGILNFGIAIGYQLVKDVAGFCGVFWLFAGVSLFGAIFSFFFVPETKGKSFREIQIILQGAEYVDDVVDVKVIKDCNIKSVEELKVLNSKNNDDK